jgi:hypothetical protein
MHRVLPKAKVMPHNQKNYVTSEEYLIENLNINKLCRFYFNREKLKLFSRKKKSQGQIVVTRPFNLTEQNYQRLISN